MRSTKERLRVFGAYSLGTIVGVEIATGPQAPLQAALRRSPRSPPPSPRLESDCFGAGHAHLDVYLSYAHSELEERGAAAAQDRQKAAHQASRAEGSPDNQRVCHNIPACNHAAHAPGEMHISRHILDVARCAQ